MLRMAKILKKYPGLTRDILRYWETQGYLSARKIPSGSKMVRIYDEKELAKIDVMWKLHRKGYAPKAAHEAAEQMLYSGKEPRTAEELLDTMYCGGETLGERLVRTQAFWQAHPKTSAFGAEWAGSQKDDKRPLVLPKDVHPRFDGQNLSEIARHVLRAIDPETDAIVAASPDTALIVGAVAVLAHAELNRPLRPFVLETNAAGSTILSGGKPAKGLRVTLVIGVLRSLKTVHEYIVRMQILGHRLLNIFAILNLLNWEEKEGVTPGTCSIHHLCTGEMLVSTAHKLLEREQKDVPKKQ